MGVGVRNFECQLGHITFVGIDHEIPTTIILPFSRFKKGSCQLMAEARAQSYG